MVGVFAFAVTQAFFSDTETSTGNVFTAGQIDLKIDHTYASYNGRDCEQECVEQENLVQNISFEVPVVTTGAKWDVYDSPVGGWIVEWYGGSTTYGSYTRPEVAKLEYHRGVLGSAHDGEQYVELDSDWQGPTGTFSGEPASVTIYQNIATTTGGNYKLRFAFAPRPNTTAANNHLEVKWDGVVVWDSGNVAGAPGGIVWQYIELDVSATGNLTELRFTDLGTPNSEGTFLDNITVNEVVCEGLIDDPLCNLWGFKDLTEGDIFWNFNDVKPGDWGTNVISYHVYDNDAYMCTFLEKTDLENDLIGPEAEAGDTSVEEGELSQYIDVFVWHDANKNGLYDNGEEMIAHDKFANLSNWPIAEPNDSIVASTDNYIGVAWCFGDLITPAVAGVFGCDGDGEYNDAQTDSLIVDLSFYAEQARHNDRFSCQNLVSPTPNGELR